MRKLAMLVALVALSTLVSVGPTLAQDDGGGASDSGAATTPDTSPQAPATDTPAPAASPGTAAPDDAAADDVAACPPGSTKPTCAAATNTDPFATVTWEGAPIDTAPPNGLKIGGVR